MGVRQRIRIGNTLIESKELSWETIREIAKELKKVANWNPDKKEWQINWRVFANIKHFIDFINEKLLFVDQQYAYRIADLIDKILVHIPRYILDNESNEVCISIIGTDPYELVRRINRETLPARIAIRRIEIPEVGEIEAPFIVTNLANILGLVEHQTKDLPVQIAEVVGDIMAEKRRAKMLVRLTERNRIHIKMPPNVPDGLIERLIDIGKIRYYYETPEGVIEEKIIDTCRVYRKKYAVDVYMPPYALIYLDELAEKYGYEIESKIGLPDKKIDGLRENYRLYPHQLKSLMNWIENRFKGTVVIPTGGGKTIIGIAAMVKTKRPTIVFVPNLWLLEQWIEKIYQFTEYPKSLIGILGKGEVDIRDITIATYQSGVRHIEKIRKRFWLAIFDECHHIPARTFRKIAMNLCAPYRLALSATPSRRDKNEVLIFKLVGGIIYSTTYSQLVKKGLLAPMIYRRIYVPLPPEKVLEYYEVQGQIDREKNQIKKRNLVNKLIAIAQENPNKIEVMKKIVEKFSSERMFVFASSIKYAKKIAMELNKLVPTVALTAQESKREQDRIIKRFKMGLISVLVIIRKAEEGVDIGEASVAIITGGSKQQRELIQRVGRVLRPKKGKIAWVFEIISEGTIEEHMARKRGGVRLVRDIADFIKKKYGIDAYREIRWREDIKLM